MCGTTFLLSIPMNHRGSRLRRFSIFPSSLHRHQSHTFAMFIFSHLYVLSPLASLTIVHLFILLSVCFLHVLFVSPLFLFVIIIIQFVSFLSLLSIPLFIPFPFCRHDSFLLYFFLSSCPIPSSPLPLTLSLPHPLWQALLEVMMAALESP